MFKSLKIMSLPKNETSIYALFECDKSCFEYLVKCKWSKGFKCRRCQHGKFGKGKKWHHRRCKKCRYDESATANTLFHKLKFPIKKAFDISYELMRNEMGLSSCEISRRFGIKQSTAWFFKRKIQQGIYGIEMGHFYKTSKQKVKSKNERTIYRTMLQAASPEFSTNLLVVTRKDKNSGRYTVRFAKASLKTHYNSIEDNGESADKQLYKRAVSKLWVNHVSFKKGKNPMLAHRYRKALIFWVKRTHKCISRKHLFYYCCEFNFRYRNLINHLKAWEMLLDVLVLHPKLAYKKLRSS